MQPWLLDICQATGENAVSNATACRWFDRFRNKDYSFQDEDRSGRPFEINMDELKQLIESDPTLSTSNVASKLGCSQPTISYRFKQLRLVGVTS